MIPPFQEIWYVDVLGQVKPRDNYPLENIQKTMENRKNIGQFITSMVMFNSYVTSYQRLNPVKTHSTTIFHGFPMVFDQFI